MKYLITIIVVLTIWFSMSLAAAQNRVVVIPLNSTKRLSNVVTVSAKGGDFTDPVAAVKSITDASESNPYLVLIGPGVYTLTKTLVMMSYVSITGSGQNGTKLTGSISSDSNDAASAIISGTDNASLRDLAVQNTGGGVYSIAIYNNTSSPIIHNVTVSASGGSSNVSIFNSSSSPSMTNVAASASGGTNSIAVSNYSSLLTMTNVVASASGGTNNWGVYNNASQPTMTNVTASASGGTNNFGIHNEFSLATITNVIATASGGADNRGVNDFSSSTTIRQGVMDGSTYGIYVTNGTTRVIQSSIVGGAGGTGTLSCVTSDNGVDKELDEICEEITLPAP